MPFVWHDLDAVTRPLIRQEIERDISLDADWKSPRLVPGGQADFRTAMLASSGTGNEVTLAAAIREGGMLRAREFRKTKHGQVEAAVPVTAAETLAEGEFNRYYIRALCLRAMNENRSLIVVRGKPVSDPRPESVAKLGTQVPSEALLEDLRTGKRVDEAFELPSGPNSGLSVRLE
ncbi:MAG: hypothetical protein WC876_02335 [Candidatus Thermoplasmatota archaeon]|jgi:hypothetical protein